MKKKSNETNYEEKGKNNIDDLIDDFMGKTEFMPMEYNFKFFKLNDKGVIKKIERNKLPFKIKNNTKYILERKEGVSYSPNYLNGPFLSSQNIIEIIDNENITIYKNQKNENKKTIKNIINNTNNTTMDNNEKTINNLLENNKKDKDKDKNNNLNTDNEKDFIQIKKIKPVKKQNDNEIIVEDNKEENEPKNKKNDNSSLYTLIKKEQILLRVPYEKYIDKEHSNILSIFLAEILDKIYIVKICCFLKKFEDFSIHLSLYLLCHLLLLSLLCAFFLIKTFIKIWEQQNYPGIDFYLLYGFLSNIIIWIIYKMFLCLLDNQDKVKELILLNNKNKNIEKENDEVENEDKEKKEDIIEDKFNKLFKEIKIKTIIYFVIMFLLVIFCFIYLLTFCAIYIGTKSKLFKSYYISLIEIIIIKLLYGICLASLRIASSGNELKTLYKIVYICDKYIS